MFSWTIGHDGTPFFGMNLVLVLVPCRALSHTPSSLPINQTQHCKLLPGMVSSQAQLCRSNLELMQTVIQAAREVKKTCQKTFSDMRWNCSSIDIPVDTGKYRPDLERGMPLHLFFVCTSFQRHPWTYWIFFLKNYLITYTSLVMAYQLWIWFVCT